MKTTTNNIGIYSMSVGKSGVCVIGNLAFNAWTQGSGMRLYKANLKGANPVYTFHLKEGPSPKAYNNQANRWAWVRAWSNQQKRGTLLNFGATEPISISLDVSLKQLHIEMPPAVMCAKVLRPKGNWKHKARLEQLDAQEVLPLDEPEASEPETKTWTQDYLVRPAYPEKEHYDTAPARPRLDLLEAIDLINQHKDILQDALVFSITPAGKLRAMVEYGG